jgi:hypothetical protein
MIAISYLLVEADMNTSIFGKCLKGVAPEYAKGTEPEWAINYCVREHNRTNGDFEPDERESERLR